MDFPVYLLRLDEQWRIQIPKNKEDIGHTDFWEQAVSGIVADFYKIPRAKLMNLPYCQRRARIVGNEAYYGGRPDADLLHALRKATGNANPIEPVLPRHQSKSNLGTIALFTKIHGAAQIARTFQLSAASYLPDEIHG